MNVNNISKGYPQGIGNTSPFQNNLNSSMNEISGMVMDVIGNRLMLDTGNDSYLDLSLKSSVPDYIKKGQLITISQNEIEKSKLVPKVATQNGAVSLKELDIKQQILFGFQLPFDKKHTEALSILKDNGLPVSKEGIVKLVGLQNKLEFVNDNMSPDMMDELSSLTDIDNQSIDSIFTKMKQLADTIPLSSSQADSIDIELLAKQLKDICDPHTLKSIISAAVKNSISPTKNNINKVNNIIYGIETIGNINGRTIGYVVKNNIELTINNLLKAKLSFDNVKNIAAPTISSGYTASGNTGASAYSSQNLWQAGVSKDVDDLTPQIVKILQLENMLDSDENINASRILVENDIDVTKDNIKKVTGLLNNIKDIKKEATPDSICKLIKNNIDVPNTRLDKLVDSFNALSQAKVGVATSANIINDAKTTVSVDATSPTIPQDAPERIAQILKTTDDNQIAFLAHNNIDVNVKNLVYSRILLCAQDSTYLDKLPENLQKQILGEFDKLGSIEDLKAPGKLQEVINNIFGNEVEQSKDFDNIVIKMPFQYSPAGERQLAETSKDALIKLNIPATEKNIELSIALCKNGLEINKQNLQKLALIDANIHPDAVADEEIKQASVINTYEQQNTENSQQLANTLNLDSKKVEANIRDILKTLSIEVNNSNLKAAKILIAAGVELTPAAIKNCSAMLEQLNALTSMKNKDINSLIKFIQQNNNISLDELFNMPTDKLMELIENADSISGKLNSDEASLKGIFTKALDSVKSMDYKSIGFLMKNNITPSLSNLLYSKGIFSAKKTIDFNNLPSMNELKDMGLISLTLTAEDDFFEKQLSLPRQLTSDVENSLNANIKPALLKMGLPITEENVDIVKSLVQNTMNVNRGSLMEILDIKNAVNDLISNSKHMDSLPKNWDTMDVRKLSSELETQIQNNPEENSRRNFKHIISSMISEIHDIDSDTISFMVKNNIPLTLKNMYATKMFTENKFMLGKQLGELKTLSDVSGDQNIHAKTKELLNNFIGKASNIASFKDKTSEVYQDILQNIKDLQTYISENPIKNSPALSKLAYDIEANMEFQSKFNVTNTLVQLPLVLNNQPTNLQFYIMNQSESGKKKRINPENMDVFLHLNTMNLGTVDTFLNFKKSTISLRFGVDNEETAKIMEADNTELSAAVLKLGYQNVNISFFVKGNDINILNAREEMIKEIERETGSEERNEKSDSNNFNIDIKA